MKSAPAHSQCSSLLCKNREPALCVGQDLFVKSTPFSVLHSVCICVFMSVCACESMYVCAVHMYTSVCVCMWMCIGVCRCVALCICVCGGCDMYDVICFLLFSSLLK